MSFYAALCRKFGRQFGHSYVRLGLNPAHQAGHMFREFATARRAALTRWAVDPV